MASDSFKTLRDVTTRVSPSGLVTLVRVFYGVARRGSDRAWTTPPCETIMSTTANFQHASMIRRELPAGEFVVAINGDKKG